MNLNEPRDLASLIEAFLLASGKPQSLERLFELFEEAERPEPKVFRQALEVLGKSCNGRAFELKEVASGYRLQFAKPTPLGSAACGKSARSAIRVPCWKPWR